MRLIYHPAAEEELVAAAQYYELQVSGLGEDFLAAVDRAVLAVQEAPNRWSVVESDIRRYLMNRFPFAIYYRPSFDNLRVLAVMHHSRHPNYWRDRLSD